MEANQFPWKAVFSLAMGFKAVGGVNYSTGIRVLTAEKKHF